MSTEAASTNQIGQTEVISASESGASLGHLDKRSAQKEVKDSRAANKLAAYFNKTLDQNFENPSDIKIALKEAPDLKVNIAHVLKNGILIDPQKAQLIARFINETLGEVAVLKHGCDHKVQGMHPTAELRQQEADPGAEIHQSKFAGSLPYLAHIARFDPNLPQGKLSLGKEKPGSLFERAKRSRIV